MTLWHCFFRAPPASTLGALVLLALPVGCSSPKPLPPVDAAVEVVDDVVDETFIGNGNLVLAWTVHGMPPATGCDDAHGVSVRFPANFVQFMADTTVPCAQGEVRLKDTAATLAAITAELLDASGHVVHTFVVEASVMPGETTTANIRFEAPGSLTVRWTANGMAPSAACPMVLAQGVRFTAQRVRSSQDSVCPGGRSVTFSNLQVGPTQVTGTLVFADRGDAGPTPDPVRVMMSGDVSSGTSTSVTLDFDAPLAM